MTDQPDQELPPAKRRRLIIGALLRGLAVTTVLVVLYYLLPLAAHRHASGLQAMTWRSPWALPVSP